MSVMVREPFDGDARRVRHQMSLCFAGEPLCDLVAQRSASRGDPAVLAKGAFDTPEDALFLAL